MLLQLIATSALALTLTLVPAEKTAKLDAHHVALLESISEFQTDSTSIYIPKFLQPTTPVLSENTDRNQDMR